jgi:two-component system sensor histidine kinase DctS
MHPVPAAPSRPPRASPTRIGLLATLVVLLVIAILAAAVWLTAAYERNEREESLAAATEAAAVALRTRLAATARDLTQVAAGLDPAAPAARFEESAAQVLVDDPSLLRIELRAADGRLLAAVEPAESRARIAGRELNPLGFEATLAKRSAMAFTRPVYSRPHYVQGVDQHGFEIVELAVPWGAGPDGALLAVHSMPRVLDHLLPWAFQRAHQVHLSEADGTMIARSSSGVRGAGVYTASAPVELQGTTLLLRANSLQTSPKLVPNALAALLITLTLALASSGLLLWRDTRRRLAAEQALREQHAFRKAMEDSLVTGLCARDLHGRITYVNPAFCEMTGFRADELVDASPPLPYRMPGQRDEAQRPEHVAGTGSARHGYETEFRRRGGERFPVLIFEAPLIDEHGRQTGWMDSILDITERRRVEEINRRQQEKLQAHARMAMLGEVASALSHELNQPLAAITSYATACENMLREPEDAPRERGTDGRHLRASPSALRAALERIRSQSERAGQVIRGVQAFVRRRRIEREPIAIDQLIRGIEPLIRLQARKWEAQLVLDLCESATVFGDRTMLEQAVLNLTRNAAEAMDGIPPALRRLEIEAAPYREAGRDWIRVAVKDCGCGVAADVESQLFSAFFTTKPDGLGIGLSLSRSVIEAHGGKLRHERRAGHGSVFAFVLPHHRAPATPAAAPEAPAGAANEPVAAA